MKKVNINNFRQPLSAEIEDIYDKIRIQYFYRRDTMQDRVTLFILLAFISYFLIRITCRIPENMWYLLIPICFLGTSIFPLLSLKRIQKELICYKKGYFVMKNAHIQEIRRGLLCRKLIIYSGDKYIFTIKVRDKEFKENDDIVVTYITDRRISWATPKIAKK